MVNPWDVQRTAEFVPCAEHVLVDGYPGLLIGRRDGLAWAMWAEEPGSLEHQWVEAGRVHQV